MRKNGLYLLYEHEIIGHIRVLTSKSTEIKSEVFASTIMKKNVNKEKFKSYLAYTNDLLRMFDEYASSLSEAIRTTKPGGKFNSIPYADIKDFVYAKYDYNAISAFVDGIMKMSSETVDYDDINNFFTHTIAKAFDDLPTSVAGLVDSIAGDASMIQMEPCNDYEIKMFMSLRSYKMFRAEERTSISKNIVNVLDFISNPDLINNHIKFTNPKMLISAINHIIEFITYALSAYCIRIYIIGRYLFPFIESSSGFGNEIAYARESVIIDDESITEATILPSDGESISTSSVTVMNSAEDGLLKKYDNCAKLMNTVIEFVTMVGASSGPIHKVQELNGDTMSTIVAGYPGTEVKQNMFSNSLLENTLYVFLTNWTDTSLSNAGQRIDELNTILKSAIFNKDQGLQGKTTDKHQLLHVIRGMKYAKTPKGVSDVASDLLKFTRLIIYGAGRNLEDLKRWSADCKMILGSGNNPTMKNNIIEIYRMVNDLYEEIAEAIIQKFKDIENDYNEINHVENDNILKKIKMNIGVDKTTNNSTNAVPDTMRLPLDLADLYSLPAFEEMCMYDVYLSSLPLFESDMYFSEAFNFSDIMNAIINYIKGGLDRLTNFVNDKRVAACVKWVEDHKETILNSYTTKISAIKVLPYKTSIELEKGLNNLIKNASTYKDGSLEKIKDTNEYEVSLYPSPDVLKWFASDDKDENSKDNKKPGEQRYWNAILFDDFDTATADPPSYQTYKSSQIHDLSESYIDNITEVNKVYQKLKKDHDELMKVANEIKKDVAQATKDQKEAEAKNKKENNGKPDGAAAANDKEQTSSDVNKQPEGNDTVVNKESVMYEDGGNPTSENVPEEKTDLQMLNANLGALQRAIYRLWNPIPHMVTKIITVQYKYLKDIYNYAADKE